MLPARARVSYRYSAVKTNLSAERWRRRCCTLAVLFSWREDASSAIANATVLLHRVFTRDRSNREIGRRPWSAWTCRSILCSVSNTVNSLLCARFDAFLIFARRGRTGSSLRLVGLLRSGKLSSLPLYIFRNVWLALRGGFDARGMDVWRKVGIRFHHERDAFRVLSLFKVLDRCRWNDHIVHEVPTYRIAISFDHRKIFLLLINRLQISIHLLN